MTEREGKFNWYRQITSLQEYVRIYPNCYLIEHLVKQPDQEWKCFPKENWEDAVWLASFKGYLPLAEVYAQVKI